MTSAFPALPQRLTRFFGRERERAEITALFRERGARLVTTLGAGGVGKTRLSLEVARDLAPDFAGRALFISLADIASATLLPVLLANALRAPMGAGDPLELTIAALAEQPTLLILDNMEHLLNEAEEEKRPEGGNGGAFIKRLLESVPTLRCLITSRQALHLDGEQEYYLPPLALPDAEPEALPQEEALARLESCASVALYVDRAQKAKADFTLTRQNARAVAALCRKLEGMPLSVEMAAAWIKTLPPARMLERMERPLEALVSRRRDLPARQASLRATCEWSYAQLPPALRTSFARLSVFRGGWTLEAAMALVGEDAPNALAELQERSLVITEESEAYSGRTPEDSATSALPRYRMLEPLREFAAEKLEAQDEQETTRCAHARFFAELAFGSDERPAGTEERQWLAWARCDQDNLRAALGWCERNDETLALRLLAPLTRFWRLSGSFAEGSDWCIRILTLPSAREPSLARAQALCEAGNLKSLQTEYTQANAYLREAQTIFGEQRDRRGQSRALNGMGSIAVFENRVSEGRAYFCQILELITEAEDAAGVASAYHGLGNVETDAENYEAAERYLERALAIRQRFADELACAYTQGSLAALARKQDRKEEALRRYRIVLDIFHRAGIPWAVALTLQHISYMSQTLGQWEQTACLLGGANTLRARLGYRLPPRKQEEQDRNLALLRSELGEAAFAQAWEQGAAMPEARMVSCAAQWIESL